MSENNSELIDAVTNELWKLDGTELLAVALVTGFDLDTIRALGGIPE